MAICELRAEICYIPPTRDSIRPGEIPEGRCPIGRSQARTGPSGCHRAGGTSREEAPIRPPWGWPLVGGDRDRSTTRMRGRVVGSSRCGAEACCGACLRRRVAVSVRAGAGGRAGLRPVVAAAGWPVCAAPSSSAPLGAVVVGVSLPRRQGESHDAEGG